MKKYLIGFALACRDLAIMLAAFAAFVLAVLFVMRMLGDHPEWALLLAVFGWFVWYLIDTTITHAQKYERAARYAASCRAALKTQAEEIHALNPRAGDEN